MKYCLTGSYAFKDGKINGFDTVFENYSELAKNSNVEKWKKMEKSLAKQGRSPFNLTNFFIVLRGLYEFF